MSSPAPPPPTPRKLDPLAAVLSYLLPGLGQVLQGRIGKGLLFFVCLYGLFFYGMRLGEMKNVWLPDTARLPDAEVPILGRVEGLPKALYYRPQFLGQFWMGVAVWPAILQYRATDPPADPADRPAPTPVLGHYMQAPPEWELNELQRRGDKRWDLAWVYTVIAGVLNILVIYDALAGPVVRDERRQPGEKPRPPHTPPVPPSEDRS
jgi:hypothetical protein